MTDAPKRTVSQELTAVIPRENLPPLSRRNLAALDLDPDHPETAELASRAVDDEPEDWRTTPTLVPCPAGCGTCSCCHGSVFVSAEQAASWRIQQVEAKSATDDDS